MTAAVCILAYLMAAVSITRLWIGFDQFAASVERDANSRRPRNLPQHADRVQANGQGGEGIHSFHGKAQ